MRVLSISPFVMDYPIHPSGGGKGKFAYELNCYLANELGATIAVMPWKEPLSGDYHWAIPGGRIIKVLGPWPASMQDRWWRRVSSALLTKRRLLLENLRNTIRAFKPDVIHLHYSYSDFPHFYQLAGFRVPLVYTSHTGAPLGDPIRGAQALSVAARVVFVSEADRKATLEVFPEVAPKSCVISCSVSQEFLPDPALEGGREGLLFVGVINERKNLSTLIRALPHLHGKRLTVCGSGPLEAEAKSLAESLGVDVRFLGNQPSSRVRKEMLACEALVVPSRREGFSITYMEALCCGIPVIGYPPNVDEASQVLGVRAGLPFHAETGTPESLARCIRELEGSGYFTRSMCSDLSARAREAFSPRAVFDRYRDIFRELSTSQPAGIGVG
jgi:glycosyltransferase involved in cell wall biosynthesis